MLSVILPTYNEKGNIVLLIEAIQNVLNKIENEFEIIVVDDNSPDKTGKNVEERHKGNSRVKVFIRTNERGLATAIRFGYEHSKGKHLIVMDTDFSHPTYVIPKLLGYLKEHDLVLASRYIKGGRMVTNRPQYYLSKLLNIFIKNYLGLKILDSTNGFFAAKREIFSSINKDKVFYGYGDYFFKLLYHLKNKNFKIKEIPFVYEKRLSGQSKTRIIREGVNYIRETLKLRFS